MANVGTMTIRVEADTTHANRNIARTNQQLVQMQVESARAQRNAARMSTVAAAGSLGATAYGAARMSGAGFLLRRNAVRGAVIGGGRAAIGGLSSGAAAGGASGVLVGAIRGAFVGGLVGLGIGAGIGVIAAATSKLVTIANEQVKYLSDLQRTAIQQRRTVQQVQAMRAAQADPFQRGGVFAMERLQRSGTAITTDQARIASNMQIASNRVDEAREALNRQALTLVGDLIIATRQLRAAGYRGAGRVLDVMSEGGRRGAFGMIAGGMVSRLTPYGSVFEGAYRGFGAARGMLPDWEGERQREAERLQMQSQVRGLRLQQLRMRGPANLMTPAPTVTAGSEQEYQFRVFQQRRGMQVEETQRWQNAVILLLQEMVRQGEAEQSQVDQARLQRGEEISSILGMQ